MRLPALLLVLSLAACKTAPPQEVAADPATAKAPSKPSSDKFGSPIGADAPIALTEVAKNSAAFAGKSFVTSGTVTAMCEHSGCWMEIKDEAGQAHVKMAGHGFSIPRSASGRRARVRASLVGPQGVAGHHEDCNEEAKAQMGHPVAKLQLEATGVELL